MLRAAGGEGCYLYALDPVEPTSLGYTRFFNPTMGIWEDPAAGTAAGPLAALLTFAGKAPPGIVVVEQGYALGRPSRIRVSVHDDVVRVSGGGLVVAEGVLYL
jgi:trans-2,3-dihydro-3-hydroxyanthranilate isomerase